MASSTLSDFHESSSTTSIIVDFWPAKKHGSSEWLRIDSEALMNRDSLQTCYKLTVRFNAGTHEVVILEEVKSTTKAGHGVRGSLRLRFSDLEQPCFEYGKKTENAITILLSLRQGTDLSLKHYSTEALGGWKDRARHMLQTKHLGNSGSKTSLIEIIFKKASKSPSSIRSHILELFSQHGVVETTSKPLSSIHGSMSAIMSHPPNTDAQSISQGPARGTIGNSVLPSAHLSTAIARQRSLLHAKARLVRKHNEVEDTTHEAKKVTEKTSTKESLDIQSAVGPFVVEASIFAPGTSADDIRSALQTVSTDITHLLRSCDITSSNPTVTAEMVFEEYAPAEVVIRTFNGQKFDDHILDMRHKRAGPGPIPKVGSQAMLSSNESAYEEGAFAALQAKILQLQEQLKTSEEKNHTSLKEIQDLQDTVTFLQDQMPREDAVRHEIPLACPGALFVYTAEPEDFVKELFDSGECTRITKVTPMPQNGFKIEYRTSEIAAKVFTSTQDLLMKRWSDNSSINLFEEVSTAVEKQPQASSLPVRDLMTEETLADLSSLDVCLPGAFPMHCETSPNLSITSSGEPTSFHTASVENHNFGVTSGADIVLNEIREIDEAVQTVANIQRDALKTGKAVSMEIRKPEDMPGWLNGEDAKSSGLRRVLTLQWTWARS